jgi:DNA-binding HxlR family transcriptional regulator
MINGSSFVKYGDLEVALLESAHALKVLYALLVEGPTGRSKLYTMISTNSRTVSDRLTALIEADLIEEVPINKPPYRALQLTEKGREVARHVQAIQTLLAR